MNYDPTIYNKDYKLYHINLGRIFLYKDYVVTEFKEGLDINFENFDELSQIILHNFKDQPFGFIANRTNSYSINLNDAELFNKTFTNAKAYAIVAYSKRTERIIEIEDHFFKFNKKVFNNFENALNWVEETLSKTA
ncbi:hypothetical protein ITJ86_08440 [Winogradskyella sp. F6397]|uniref:STAS/SEC14 domain-containing protein n=1 Tax=Winogradskyella marina TaxID=2785530 RepID=A0ABS0EHL2_9FLAO|nr:MULTISPECIES: hypothetical protein [Winogradskyella]MBF8149924.1 hypothetical protein [Winogradskyella marina]